MQPVDRITDIFSSIAPEIATHYSPETEVSYAAFWRMESGAAREVWVVHPGGRLWHTHNPPLTPGDGMALLALPERRSLPTTRVFLSGPMSGLPENNYPAFRAEAERLRSLGYHVESPAENDPPECGTWHGYMRKAVAQLLTCDVIALLPDWSESRGSLMERQLAVTLGMPAIQANKIQNPHKEAQSCAV